MKIRPNNIGRTSFVDVLLMKFGVFVLLIKRDTNIFYLRFKL